MLLINNTLALQQHNTNYKKCMKQRECEIGNKCIYINVKSGNFCILDYHIGTHTKLRRGEQVYRR